MSLLPCNVTHANPPAVIPLLEDDMVLKGMRSTPVDDGSDLPPETFADRVRIIFPKGATARLARSADVNTRQAQRWMAGQAEPPAQVVQFVEEQIAILQNVHIETWLRNMILHLQDEKHMHGEVIASQIADAYDALIGRELD